MNNSIYILSIQNKTIFIKLNDLYPECKFLLRDLNLNFLWCLNNDICPRNSNCMEKLAKRLRSVFDKFKSVELVLLYFSCRDTPASIKAGVFFKDFREPYIITFNRSSWVKLKNMGKIYQWTLPNEFFISNEIELKI